nr:hypothetical protein [Tanacetum cinerariifolium]
KLVGKKGAGSPRSAMLTMRARRFLQKTGRNLGANGPTSMGFDMSKVECYNCHKKGHFARECRAPKDSRRNEEEPANYALMAFSSSSSSSDNEVPSCSKAYLKAYAQLHSQYDKLTDDFCKSQFVVISYQTGLESVEARLLVYKQNESIFEENIKLLNIKVQLRDNALVTLRKKLEKAPIIEDWVSDSEDVSETKAPQIVPSFVQSSEQMKSLRNYVQQVETFISATTPKLASSKPASNGKRRNRKACFVCKSVDHLIKDCNFHAKKMAQPTPRNHAHRGTLKQYAPLTHTNPQKHMVPATVLTQSKPVVRLVSADVNSPPRVTVVKATVVSVAQDIQGKWSNPQHALKDKGVIDSGYSRHMTGNMSYLFDFKDLNGGYVTFGGNPKGGKISGKGKIKTQNQLSLKVKVTRSDNGTEFMNNDLNQFCGMKGIQCTKNSSAKWHC